MAAEAAAGEDIVDTAVAAGDFDTLVTAVQAAGLEETLRGEGPYTVFAPTDAAFDALPAGTLDTLLADPEGDLADILTYHVVEGDVPAADVVGLDGQEVTTVNGTVFTVGVADDGAVTLTDAAGNDVAVTQTDVEASNGVVDRRCRAPPAQPVGRLSREAPSPRARPASARGPGSRPAGAGSSPGTPRCGRRRRSG